VVQNFFNHYFHICILEIDKNWGKVINITGSSYENVQNPYKDKKTDDRKLWGRAVYVM
jgi:hypothetical protein